MDFSPKEYKETAKTYFKDASPRAVVAGIAGTTYAILDHHPIVSTLAGIVGAISGLSAAGYAFLGLNCLKLAAKARRGENLNL